MVGVESARVKHYSIELTLVGKEEDINYVLREIYEIGKRKGAYLKITGTSSAY